MEEEEEPHLLQGEGQQAEQARGAGESVWEQERRRRDPDLWAGVPETGNAPPLHPLHPLHPVQAVPERKDVSPLLSLQGKLHH